MGIPILIGAAIGATAYAVLGGQHWMVMAPVLIIASIIGAGVASLRNR